MLFYMIKGNGMNGLLPMKEDQFRALFGITPIQDDLERVNCGKAGEIGHSHCGICECGQPRFICGHVQSGIKSPS
jgi:hypothetical protein